MIKYYVRESRSDWDIPTGYEVVEQKIGSHVIESAICHCRSQADAANICTAMNRSERWVFEDISRDYSDVMDDRGEI